MFLRIKKLFIRKHVMYLQYFPVETCLHLLHGTVKKNPSKADQNDCPPVTNNKTGKLSYIQILNI